MDIKFVWIEEFRKHAYILTLIDTFTRVALHYTVKYSIKKEDVKQVWEHIITEHLQPSNCLNRSISIEIRNDNDKRFSATMIQDYFTENNLNQFFTHSYTPQENAHIESFHTILSRHLKPYQFWSLEELEQNLVLLYERYNNTRLHGCTATLSPRDFWTLWDLGHIDKKVNEAKRILKFKLRIPYHQVKQYTGYNELEESTLHDFETLDGSIKSNK